ncbi:unnamed protein product [Musa acuminata subsp. malaccensis]|uniref:(wild Malaysian banana) hypothetical protein n=1 Tax=Musa acuminata subsp. malaccensis TaxID=214687 RepID=A0A804I9I0_MUSAM|nr:unnamed protein product [Musa acuminata subsp. malaccensis]
MVLYAMNFRSCLSYFITLVLEMILTLLIGEPLPCIRVLPHANQVLAAKRNSHGFSNSLAHQ